jgi:hypothetical protein
MRTTIPEHEMDGFLRELAEDESIPERVGVALHRVADRLEALQEVADQVWGLKDDLVVAEAEAATCVDMRDALRDAILDYDRGIIDRAELVKAAR